MKSAPLTPSTPPARWSAALHTSRSSWTPWPKSSWRGLYVCLYAHYDVCMYCMYARMYTRTFDNHTLYKITHTYINTHIYCILRARRHIHTYIYTCMNVCMYVCMCSWPLVYVCSMLSTLIPMSGVYRRIRTYTIVSHIQFNHWLFKRLLLYFQLLYRCVTPAL